MKRWAVCKRNGQWRVMDSGVWHDTFESLSEAHTFATQCAVADKLFEPGGLVYLSDLQAAYYELLRIKLKGWISSQ